MRAKSPLQRTHKQRGVAVVEFAMVLPVLLLVIAGLAANALAGLVRGATAESGLGNPNLLANIARIAVLGFGVVVAVNQIGVGYNLAIPCPATAKNVHLTVRLEPAGGGQPLFYSSGTFGLDRRAMLAAPMATQSSTVLK